jgi:hypothetical protein
VYSSALTGNSQTYAQFVYKASNYYYEAMQVNVGETGCYSFGINSSVDTFGYIYLDTFNPLFPSRSLIIQNGERLNNMQFKHPTRLHASVTYILVVTTSSPNVTGSFSILVSGPNNVSLNHISEYMHSLVNNLHRSSEQKIFVNLAVIMYLIKKDLGNSLLYREQHLQPHLLTM